MAGCMFLGKRPSLCPFSFRVEAPCYEKCWEAETAAECLQHLRTLPPQLDFATAIRKLRSFAGEQSFCMEMSGFGMITVLLGAYLTSTSQRATHKLTVYAGLHSILFQTTQADIDYQFSSKPAHAQVLQQGDPENLLEYHFACGTISNLADFSISHYGSPSMKHMNMTLKAWRLVWDQRQFRDVENDSYRFCTDALPFWYLAKLYVVLHFYGNLVCEESDFSVFRGGSQAGQFKNRVRDKILNWLILFRWQASEKVHDSARLEKIQSPASVSGLENSLPQLMGPLSV